MREALNKETLANTVSMVRGESSRLLLVVEGDDDHFTLRGHASQDLDVLAGTGGKSNVLEAAALVESRQIKGVKFLVDLDYDRFVAPNRVYPANVITSSNHDFFMDIVARSEHTLRKTIAAHGRKVGRADGRPEIRASSIHASATTLAFSLAPLRIINDRFGLGLKLESFPFGSLRSLTPSALEIARVALDRSNVQIAAAQLAGMIQRESHKLTMLPSEVIGDHDFFGAISRTLADHGVKVSPHRIFDSFLSSIHCTPLTKTEWYSEITAWASSNRRVAFQCVAATGSCS